MRIFIRFDESEGDPRFIEFTTRNRGTNESDVSLIKSLISQTAFADISNSTFFVVDDPTLLKKRVS